MQVQNDSNNNNTYFSLNNLLWAVSLGYYQPEGAAAQSEQKAKAQLRAQELRALPPLQLSEGVFLSKSRSNGQVYRQLKAHGFFADKPKLRRETFEKSVSMDKNAFQGYARSLSK